MSGANVERILAWKSDCGNVRKEKNHFPAALPRNFFISRGDEKENFNLAICSRSEPPHCLTFDIFQLNIVQALGIEPVEPVTVRVRPKNEVISARRRIRRKPDRLSYDIGCPG